MSTGMHIRTDDGVNWYSTAEKKGVVKTIIACHEHCYHCCPHGQATVTSCTLHQKGVVVSRWRPL